MRAALTRRALVGVVMAGMAATCSVSACNAIGDLGESGPVPGSTSGVGGSGGDPTEAPPPPPPPPFKPAPGGLRRLLKEQYIGSLEVLFGEAAAAVASAPLDQPLKGYDAIGASELITSSSAVDIYEFSSRDVAALVVGDPIARAAVIPCEPVLPDDEACLLEFAESLGRIAWRRQLTDDELARIVGAAKVAGSSYKTVDASLEGVISAILQSPYFQYMVELGTPDERDPTLRHLTPNELVTRMSFFLNNRGPTKEMLDAAEAGELDSDAGIRAMALVLLERPEARAALDALYDEVLRLRDIDITQKDEALFPEFTDSLKTAMREETLRLVRDVIWTRNADARELFDADYSFVNAELAALYDLPAPSGNEFAKVTLPADQNRRGLLGQAALLSVLSHTNSTSPTRRGSFVQAQLLCRPVPPPPEGVVPVLPPDSGDPTSVKEKLEVHMKDPSCSGCHVLMDPIGFALETFDAIGAFRSHDVGVPIDSSGSVPDLGDFANASELSTRLRDDPRSTECMVRHLFRHALGHLETQGERAPLQELDAAFARQGHRIQDLLVELTLSPAFRTVGEPK